mmetsp:Transcript_34082/g.53145  ORF Transcript_34082/g.53145 Transcript_34082/m.53145 type:complete len:90 (-) Transcript_34082:1128-1397(-)
MKSTIIKSMRKRRRTGGKAGLRCQRTADRKWQKQERKSCTSWSTCINEDTKVWIWKPSANLERPSNPLGERMKYNIDVEIYCAKEKLLH